MNTALRGIPQINSYETWKRALETTEYVQTRVAVIRSVRSLFAQFDAETRLKFLKELVACARNPAGGDEVRSEAIEEFLRYAKSVTFGEILRSADTNLVVSLTGFLESAQEIPSRRATAKKKRRAGKRMTHLITEWLRSLSEGYRPDFAPEVIERFEVAAVRVLHQRFQIMRIWRIALREPAMRKMRRLIEEMYPSVEAGLAAGDETAACYVLMQSRRNSTARREMRAGVPKLI